MLSLVLAQTCILPGPLYRISGAGFASAPAELPTRTLLVPQIGVYVST